MTPTPLRSQTLPAALSWSVLIVPCPSCHTAEADYTDDYPQCFLQRGRLIFWSSFKSACTEHSKSSPCHPTKRLQLLPIVTSLKILSPPAIGLLHTGSNQSRATRMALRIQILQGPYGGLAPHGLRPIPGIQTTVRSSHHEGKLFGRM